MRELWKYVLVQAVLVLFAIWSLYPVLWVISTSFKSINVLFSTTLKLIPDHPTLENYVKLFKEYPFLLWLKNSFFVSFLTTVLGVSIGATAAYAFSRFEFAGKRAGLVSLLVTQMFPGVMSMIPLYLILKNLGILGTHLGLIIAYCAGALPFSVWNLKGFFDTIPKELEEAALIDGATIGKAFWTVIMPLARPGLAVTALFNFMGAWTEYILAATFLFDESKYTVPVGLRMFVGQYSTQWTLFAAGAVIVSIPVVVLFFFLQKHLISGLTAGSIKG